MKTQLRLQKYQLITKTDNNILQYIPLNCLENGTQKLTQKIKLKLTTKQGNQYDEYFTDAFSIEDVDPTNQFYQKIQDLLTMLSDSSNFKISVDEDGESKWLHLYAPAQKQAILDIYFKKSLQIYTLCHQIQKKCQSQEELTDIDIKNLFKLVSKNLKVILNRTQNKNLFVLNKKSSYHSSGLQSDINFQLDEYFSKSHNLEENQKKLQQRIIKIHQQLQIQSRGGKADKQYQQKLNKEIEQYKKQLKQTKEKSQHLQRTIKNLPVELSKQLNDILKLTNSQIQNKPTNVVPKKQEIKKAIDSVDENSNHFQRLKFNNNEIVALGPANIFFKLKDVKEFKIKVNRLHNYIGIGLINSNYNRQAKIGQDFMKYGSNGCYFDGKSQKYGNTPFRQGQEITMIVDLKQGRISWKAQQKQIFATEHPKLKNSKVKWTPYILMMDAQDSVILLK